MGTLLTITADPARLRDSLQRLQKRLFAPDIKSAEYYCWVMRRKEGVGRTHLIAVPWNPKAVVCKSRIWIPRERHRADDRWELSWSHEGTINCQRCRRFVKANGLPLQRLCPDELRIPVEPSEAWVVRDWLMDHDRYEDADEWLKYLPELTSE